MEFLYLIFYACLRLRFLNVKTNNGPRRPVLAVCRLLSSKVQGLAWNLSDLAVASSRYDLLLCSETLVSDIRHVSELLVPDLVALSCCAGAVFLQHQVNWNAVCGAIQDLPGLTFGLLTFLLKF